MRSPCPKLHERARPTAATQPTAPLRTALYETHRDAGARLIDFAGWEMPVQYAGIIDEHRAVRSAAGLFDLSHMGEVWIDGPEAAEALACALVSDPRRLALGRAHYSMIVAPDGGIIDDLDRLPDRARAIPGGPERIQPRDGRRRPGRTALGEATPNSTMPRLRTSLIAVQGPNARRIVAPLTDVDLDSLKYYSIARGSIAGTDAWVARTGYTGEDGFELFVSWDSAPALWQTLMAAGRDQGLVPAGLGARDTLRLEAGMPLYGNELDRDTRSGRGGPRRVVKLDKDVDFVGRRALEAAAERGPRKQLVGLELRDRGIARHGYPDARGGS